MSLQLRGGEDDNAELWTQLARSLAASSQATLLDATSTVSLTTFRGFGLGSNSVVAGPRVGDSSEYEHNLLISELMGGSHRVGVTSLDAVTTDISGTSQVVDEMCPICQEMVDPKGEVRRTACGHTFCGPCIGTWLTGSKRCPVCMMQLQP